MSRVNEIEGLQERIQGIKEKQRLLKTKHSEVRTSVAYIKRQIKNNEEENEKLQRNIAELKSEEIEIAEEYNPLNSVLDDLEQKIATIERNEAIAELLEEQPSFYNALKLRLDMKHKELSEMASSFISLNDPATVIQSVQSVIESNAINMDAAALRQGKANYEETIKQLVEMKIDGKAISINEGQRPIKAIDSFLDLSQVTKMLQKS